MILILNICLVLLSPQTDGGPQTEGGPQNRLVSADRDTEQVFFLSHVSTHLLKTNNLLPAKLHFCFQAAPNHPESESSEFVFQRPTETRVWIQRAAELQLNCCKI